MKAYSGQDNSLSAMAKQVMQQWACGQEGTRYQAISGFLNPSFSLTVGQEKVLSGKRHAYKQDHPFLI